MYDRCCEVKEWSVVPFAIQENGVLYVPVKDQDHTPSPHDTMTKRSTAKLMGKPLATAKETSELAFSSPRSIIQTGQRRINNFPPEDSTRLTKSDDHVVGTYLPVESNGHGSRAQPAYLTPTIPAITKRQNPKSMNKLLSMLSTRTNSSVPAHLTSVDPNHTPSSTYTLSIEPRWDETAFSAKSPKLAILEQVRDQMRARRSVKYDMAQCRICAGRDLFSGFHYRT
jgi:hypothetical protein